MGVMNTASFEALGGTAIVGVADGDQLVAAIESVRLTVDAFDRACSSYRPDSELSGVNAAAGLPRRVSPLFIEALEAAIRAAELTDGDVDPTVGEALVAHGFFDGRPPIASRPKLTLRTVPGYQAIAIDRDAGTVTIPHGVRLDLGATAKALAADHAAVAASAATGTGVLVSLSGDLSICGQPPAEGWRVRVTDDHRSDVTVPGQWIFLRTGGLASSSTTVHRRGDGESTSHHVIDPSTGAPAEVHFRTVTVAAASCLDANIASTATIVRGERAVGWLAANGLPSRLVTAAGTVIHVGDWPTAGEELPLASMVGVP